MILGNLLKFVRWTVVRSSERFPQNSYLQRSNFTYFALRAVLLVGLAVAACHPF